MANVDTKHPEWIDHRDEWQEMRDTARGATAVKREGVNYLPQPSAYGAHPDPYIGRAMYSAYQTRAQFPELVTPTVAGIVGLIHRFEFQYEGISEAGLDFLWEKATRNGEGLPLEAFHTELTYQITEAGRYAVLVDVPSNGSERLPYFAPYAAENLINWSDERDLFVLDESGPRRVDEFRWDHEEEYRVLRLRDGRYSSQIYHRKEPGEIVYPQASGRMLLGEIPIVVIGARKVALEVEMPPLIGVARSALALYRLDADYRLQLYMSGQETLFVSGATDAQLPKTFGAGIVHSLPADAVAQFVGPAGVGINAHREAISDERENAVQQGARIFDSTEQPVESGAAKSIRFAAETATIQTIAQASAKGMEMLLRYAAMFLGVDEARRQNIIVVPPSEFVDNKLQPSEAEALTRVWMSKAISKETLYENLLAGGIASPERSFEEEERLIEEEIADDPIAVSAMESAAANAELARQNAVRAGEEEDDA